MRGGGVLVLLAAFSAPAFAADPVGQPSEPVGQPTEPVGIPNQPSGQRGEGMFGRQRPGEGRGQGREVSAQEVTAVRDLSHRVDHVEEAAEIAMENASTPELRELAAQMEQAYEQLSNELGRWAQHHDVDLGDAPQRFAARIDELRGLSGEAFDDAFLDLVSQEGADVSKELENVANTVGGRGFQRDMDRTKTSLDRFNQEIDRQIGGEESP